MTENTGIYWNSRYRRTDPKPVYTDFYRQKSRSHLFLNKWQLAEENHQFSSFWISSNKKLLMASHSTVKSPRWQTLPSHPLLTIHIRVSFLTMKYSFRNYETFKGSFQDDRSQNKQTRKWNSEEKRHDPITEENSKQNYN